MIKLYIATALVISFSAPAFAGHCPRDVKRIDEAIPMTTELTAEQLAEIMTLRDEGEMLHGSGSHGDSLSVLHAALLLLGIEPH
ncbi:hypothetical protein [Candidatus Halocynthiibacter alkanivorans]|uniref:hypothetical protein n=1 Tax=Candidatus Halocynthiibacter alkanivorans TaxID=2267619 RepID=UPI000DF42A8C|nr:hypothetical protein [Candidatus Halocynthiibacter alkanivorans]